jgi:hypothetical protein
MGLALVLLCSLAGCEVCDEDAAPLAEFTVDCIRSTVGEDAPLRRAAVAAAKALARANPTCVERFRALRLRSELSRQASLSAQEEQLLKRISRSQSKS